jgi:DNA-binding MarR family transcriptional regulator
MTGGLSYDLHKLTSRMDRVADEILRRQEAITYSRFLALLAVRRSEGTQRDLARWLGLSDPSASRMVRLLAAEGLLTVTTTPGGGNRRTLRLTPTGSGLVDRCGLLLEEHFSAVVGRSGVPYEDYHRFTRRLLEHLSTGSTPPRLETPA